jgi:flagellar biosynthesis protein FlhB
VRVVGWGAVAAAGPLVLSFMVAGLAAAVVQNAPIPVLSRIAPDFSRISLSKGWNRLFSMMGLLEMMKTLARFLAFILCGVVLLIAVRAAFQNSALVDLVPALLLTRKATLCVLAGLVCVSGGMLLLDLPLTYGFWRRELRMTRQEVRDEHKESEGDPHMKARRRSAAKSRSRQRNLAAVPKATVIITNPTHFAVALRYVREEGGAPQLVAKGQDLIALEIRRIAQVNAIPIVEDKLLARSLYAKVDVDQVIPIEFYRVVAEILIRLQGRRKPVALKR